MKSVVSKISVVALFVVLFSFSNVGQAYSALRDLRTEFYEALKQLDVDKINSLLKEEGLRDNGARKITEIAIAVSPFIRITRRSAYAVEIEKRCISIIKAVSKTDKDFKTIDLHFFPLAELLTNPLLNALLEAGLNPNKATPIPHGTDRPILYATVLNWRLGENVLVVKRNSYSHHFHDDVSMIKRYAGDLETRNREDLSFLSPSIQDRIRNEIISMKEPQPFMLLTREEVIERMKILVKYKIEFTYPSYQKKDPIIEFFLREFFDIFRVKMEEFENYSPDDDIAFASEIIGILKKAGADTKSAKKYLEEKKYSYRSYPDMVKEIEKLEKSLNSGFFSFF